VVRRILQDGKTHGAGLGQGIRPLDPIKETRQHTGGHPGKDHHDGRDDENLDQAESPAMGKSDPSSRTDRSGRFRFRGWPQANAAAAGRWAHEGSLQTPYSVNEWRLTVNPAGANWSIPEVQASTSYTFWQVSHRKWW
jgi:hypothetical protein